VISGSSLPTPTIASNWATSDLEIYFDTLTPIVSGEFQIDDVHYTPSGESPQVDQYIYGESFGVGIIYTSVDENNGTLYRSRDLGMSWEWISSGANIMSNQ
jgi:hypothetical protein